MASNTVAVPGMMDKNREQRHQELRPGCRIWCKTVFDKEYEGEVIAYDAELSAVVIKTPSVNSSGKGGKKLNDVHIINLKFIPEDRFKIKSPSKGGTTVPIDIDHDKIERRLRQALADKTRALEKIGVGVTVEAQSLFDYLSTMFRDCHWKDNSIVLMDDVTISPPYSPENCSGINKESLERIQKMVSKFHNDRQKTKEAT